MWVENGKAGWNVLTQGHEASLGPGIGQILSVLSCSDEELASSGLVKIYLPN